jgi:signal transduction histidine kinase
MPATGYELMNEDTDKKQSEPNSVINMAGGIAHHFNNALAGISLNVDMLERKAGEDQQLTRFLNPIRSSVRKMTRLTGQLVASTQGGVFRPRSITVKRLIDKTIEQIDKETARFVHLVIERSCASFLVNVDLEQVLNAFAEIIANAVEAMSGPVEERRIHILCQLLDKRGHRGERPFVSISINDNGSGMDRLTREHLFEPFFSTRCYGRGMGLAAARGIIENHGGTISVNSKPGKGTCVTVCLPSESTWKAAAPSFEN